MTNVALPSNLEQDEKAIRAVEAAYDSAWQTGDVDGLLKCLTSDAVLVNPRGEMARGHAEIQRVLSEFLSGAAAGSKHTSVLSRIEFVTAEVVIVDGTALIEMPAKVGQPTSAVTHHFTDVLVRRDNRWAIAHVRAYVFMPKPT